MLNVSFRGLIVLEVEGWEVPARDPGDAALLLMRQPCVTIRSNLGEFGEGAAVVRAVRALGSPGRSSGWIVDSGYQPLPGAWQRPKARQDR